MTTDAFVPLAPVAPADQSASSAPAFEVLPATPDKAAFETLLGASADPSRSPDPCGAKPSVTLKREGDVVTGIRVQCGCGRVIDLTCVY